MILWTIVPDDVLFGEPERVVRRLATVAGRRVECERQGDGWRIATLLSTDPRDFLDPALAPGTPVPDGAVPASVDAAERDETPGA